MFHRALAVSVIGTVALAAPVAAMAAAAGGGSTGETATTVVIHLPRRAQPGEPFTVTAQVVPRDDTGVSGSPDGSDGSADSTDDSADAPDTAPDPDQPAAGMAVAAAATMGATGTGATGTGDGQGGTVHGKGKAKAKGTGHHKGTGHKGKGKTKPKRHAVTGEVSFTLDGKAMPPIEVARDQASEQISVPLGRHTISAEYSGDSHFEGADSTTVTFALTDGTQQEGGSPQQ
jgi:hypothetical protein